MAILSGSKIEAADYNNMQSKVANVLGTGAGNKGYGQTVLSRPVSKTNTITAAQLQNLKTDLNKIKFHQNNIATAVPSVVANTLIKADDWIVYDTEATNLENARFTISSDVSQATKVINLQRAYTTWNGQQTHNVIVDFGSPDAGRYFFNAGGEIFLEPSHSGNTLPKGANWAALYASFVPVRVAHSTTTARAGTNTNIGWYGLTSTDQIIFTIAATGTYAGNNYTVKGRCDVTNNSAGTARYLYLTIELSDVGSNPGADLNVDGVSTNKVSNNRATGAYVEVAAPNITDNYVTPAGTYILTANPATTSNEGVAITFTLATSNLPSGSIVPYTISGTGITSADFGGASLTGNFTLDANGFATVTYTTAIDHFTEGDETFTLRLNNNGASVSYVIIDTSLSFPTITTNPVITMLPNTEVEGVLSIVSNTVWNPANSGFSQYALWQSSTDGTTFNDTANFDLTYKTVTNDIGKYWRVRQASTNNETLSYSNVIGPVKLTQTYTLTANPVSQATEGTSVTITLTTFNVNDGVFPYTISGTGITASDFGLTSLTGSFNLVNSTASVTLNLVNDQNQTEVAEDFTLALNNGKANIIYRINDPISGYSFASPPPASVDEGSTTTFSITTVNVYFTTLYWDIDYNSNSTAAADFSASYGSFPLVNNAGTFDVSVVNDLIKEGTESFRVRVRSGSVTGPPVLTSNLININDTSVTTITTLTFAKSSYLIGQQSILNWTITGTDYDTIQVSILKPNGSALSTSGSLAKTIRTFSSSSVFNVEGNHTAIVALYKGAVKMTENQIVTSVGAAPTYSLTRSAASGSENLPFTFTLTTTNVESNTLIPFTITRSVQTVSLTNDFSNWVLNGVALTPSLTGSFLAQSGGTNPDIATLVVTPADDRITEASGEVFTLSLQSPGSGSIAYTITDPNLTAAAFSFTPLIGQEGNIPVNSSNVTITGLEPNLSTLVTATGGAVDAGTTALSGTFAASKTITSSSSGTILVAAQVTTGALGQIAKSVTITVNAKTNAAFTATTRLGDVDGNLSSPMNVTGAELNTVTTAEAVFTSLDPNASVTVTAASGFISNNASSGFATSCTLTTDANGSASIWYRLTSANAVSSTVTMGTLTVKSAGASKAFAPNWSVTTRTADLVGTLTNPPNITNSATNTVITSAAATISGLQPSYTFTLSGGLISTSSTGTFAASISITSNASGTITFYFRLTSALGYSTTFTVPTMLLTDGVRYELYTPTWSVTTKAFLISGTLGSPANTTNAELNVATTSAAAAFSGLEPSYLFTLSAASGEVSNSASSGFSTSCTVITNASGAASIYYRLTSSPTNNTPVTMGQLTLTGNGQNQTYTPTWTVTTRAYKFSGTYTAPANPAASPTGSIIYTSGAATISGLELTKAYTITVANGDVSGSDQFGFAGSCSANTDSTGKLTFYYRLTSPATAGTATPGTLTLTSPNATGSQTYTSAWTVTTKAVDFDGVKYYNTVVQKDALLNTLYSTSVDYGGLEPNYTFTLTPNYGELSLDNVNWGPSITFTTNATGGAPRYYLRFYSASDFLTAKSVGGYTLSALGQTSKISTDTAWTVTTKALNIGGTFTSPTWVNNATRSTIYVGRCTFKGMEPNYTFLLKRAGLGALLSNSETGPFDIQTNVTSDATGFGVFYWQITSSSLYSTSISSPGFNFSGGGSTILASASFQVTTLADPLIVTITVPSDIPTATFNTYYTGTGTFTGAKNTNYTISIASGEISLSNGNWASSIGVNPGASTSVTIWYRLQAGSTPGAKVQMGALSITHNDSNTTKSFASVSTWTLTTIVTSKVSGTWSVPTQVYGAVPDREYTVSTRIYALTPNYPYTLIATASFPSNQAFQGPVEASRVQVSADNQTWGNTITWTTDGTGGNTVYYKIKALPVSGQIRISITVQSGPYSYTLATAWSVYTT
jgi:hypothetical protein